VSLGGARERDARGTRLSCIRGAALALCLFAGPAAAAEMTLKAAAASSGRYFGAALDSGDFDEKPYVRLATEELSAVTPENAMKWAVVEPARGVFDWRAADRLFAFAQANGQKIRGHTLVWHQQLPAWLTGGTFAPAELRQLMIDHVTLEASRYRGADYAWDVVNEPFADDGAWRPSIWLQAMGPDYVETALRAARAADPQAKLYINDYNVESAGPKMRALYELAASLKRKGAPLDGVGFESHLVAGSPLGDMREVMQAFADLGVDVAVTELDLRIKTPPDAKALDTQAADYAKVIGACVAVKECVGVSTWGVTDAHSWTPFFFAGYGAALPFDESYQPKPAFFAAIDALTRAERQ